MCVSLGAGKLDRAGIVEHHKCVGWQVIEDRGWPVEEIRSKEIDRGWRDSADRAVEGALQLLSDFEAKGCEFQLAKRDRSGAEIPDWKLHRGKKRHRVQSIVGPL